MLQPYLSTLPVTARKPTINYKTLLRWLTQMQGSEIELGGFKGRTNKLVDGCYSWWVGGALPLLQSLGVGKQHHSEDSLHPESDAGGEHWDDVDDSLFNNTALQEYILYAGQHPAGGLRDKPPKSADSYHTLYCLSGLSSAQHSIFSSSKRRSELLKAWKASPGPLESLRKSAFVEALSWSEEEGTAKYVGGQVNQVNATHPLFNLTITHTEALMGYFYHQDVPARIVTSGSR
jgi:protein farnesyltransferase subunit beta